MSETGKVFPLLVHMDIGHTCPCSSSRSVGKTSVQKNVLVLQFSCFWVKKCKCCTIDLLSLQVRAVFFHTFPLSQDLQYTGVLDLLSLDAYVLVLCSNVMVMVREYISSYRTNDCCCFDSAQANSARSQIFRT